MLEKSKAVCKILDFSRLLHSKLFLIDWKFKVSKVQIPVVAVGEKI